LKRYSSFVHFVILFIFIASISSCKSKKVLVTDTKDATLENLVSQIQSNAFYPEWFKAKAQLQYKADGRGLSFTSTIISKDKELLWLNGKKFGIEGARILVKPDSIFAINRLQKEYLADDMNWVAREYELPSLLSEAISLNHLQDIFIGNPILDIISYSDLVNKDNEVLLTGEKDGFASKLIINPNNLQTRFFTFSQGENNMTVKYSDYRPVNNSHSIAYKRELLIQRPDEEDLQLTIQYDNIVIDEPQSVKFKIPGSYSKM